MHAVKAPVIEIDQAAGGVVLHRYPNVASVNVERGRTVVVALPPGYERSTVHRFPVLYMQDGQNLFDPTTSFIPGHYWAMERAIAALVKAREIMPLIVVGIYNTGEHRIDEYTPSRDERVGRGGGADRYGRFVVEELIPFVDATYRTHSDPALTGIGGSSLGGLVSLYLGLRYPHVFGRIAALSPAVWWDRRAFARYVRDLPGPTSQRIWLDMGTREGLGLTGTARDLRDAFVGRGWRPGTDVAYHEARNARHNELAWARRIGLALKFLYGVQRGPRSRPRR